MKLATYKCLRCTHEWSTPIEGGIPPLANGHSLECPECRNIWFKWTNYDKDFAK